MSDHTEEEIRTGMRYSQLGDGGRIGIGSPLGHDMLASLKGAERIGAVAVEHRRGSACIWPNLFRVGHSLEKHSLPTNRLLRWFAEWSLKRGVNPFGEWSLQVQFGSSSMGSNALTRSLAVARCRKWIDEEIADELKAVKK